MNETVTSNHPNRILVVDDTGANLQLLVTLLKEQGYAVHPASDGELALEFVRNTLPDLILLDIHMPGMDGFEVCRHLKAEERTRDIPVIFISILEDEGDKVLGFQAGAVDYITKPFQPDEILARIRTHLRLRELTERLEQEVAERTGELTKANQRLEQEIVEREQAEEELQRNLGLQKALLSLYQDLEAAPTNNVISFVVGRCVNLTGSDIGFVGLISDDDQQMEAHIYSDKVIEKCLLDKPTVFPLNGAGLWAEPIRQRRLVIVNDYCAPIPAERGYPEGHVELSRFMGVPVVDQGRVVAVAGLANRLQEYSKADHYLISPLLEGMWDLIKRKRAEDLSKQSLENLKEAQQLARIGSWELDLTTDSLFWSDEVCRIFEIDPEKFGASYQAFLNTVHPDDREAVNSSFTSSLEDEKLYSIDHRILLPDGRVKYVHERCITEYENDKPVRSIGTVQEITERKQAEMGLQRANDLLRAIIEAAPVAILGLDLDGNVRTVWNPAAEKMLGWSAQEVMGQPLPTVPQENREEFSRFREMIRRGLTLDGVEVCRQRRDGTPIDYSIYASPLRDEEERITGNIAVLVDQTERKQREEAMRRLNRELQALSTCNQTLMRAQDEQTLLNDVCHIVCEEAGYGLAWVGYAEHDDAKTVRRVAWYGEYEEYVAEIKLSWSEDSECGQGPVGEAIRSGDVVHVQDLATDPRVVPWRERARQGGFCSCIALPLTDDKAQVFGVLLAYHGQANVISPQELKFVKELADDLAFGICVLRTRAELRAAEIRFRMTVDNATDGFFLHDSDGFGRVLDVNQEACTSLGYSREELLGMNPLDFDPAVDPAFFEGLAPRLAAGERISFETHHRRKNGSEFPVEVSVRQFSSGGKAFNVSLARDISDRKRAEEERQAHVWFLEGMNQVNRAIQKVDNIDRMMSDVLDAVLSIFDCDRAYLVYPNDPDAPSWTAPMERTKPEYPGVLTLNLEIPTDSEIAEAFRLLLASGGPVTFGPGSEHPVPADCAAQFGFKSNIAMALCPKEGSPWQFGIHQCTHPRVWTEEEKRLFREIGRRLEDALTSLIMQRNLLESEKRYRLVFEHSPISLWEEDFSAVKVYFDGLRDQGIVDIEAWFGQHPEAVRHCADATKIVNVNRAALTLHEATSKEELMAGLITTFTSESFDTFHQELICLWNGETKMTGDAVVKTLTGNRRNVTVCFSVCPGHEETLSRVLVSLIDITERKQMEEILRQSERTKALLGEIAGVFLSVPDDEMYEKVALLILQALRSKLGIFGYIGDNGDLVIPSFSRDVWSACDVAGKSVVFPADTWGESLWGRAIRERKSFVSDGPFHMPDGHVPVEHFLAVPIVFGAKTIGLISVANAPQSYTDDDRVLLETITSYISPILNARLERDLQEERRKSAEETLRKLSQAVEQSPASIVITDPDGTIEYVNPKFEEITEYTSEEAIGENPRILMTGETSPEEYQRLWATITRGEVWRGEFRNRKKSGELYWESASISPVFDTGGNIRHFLGVKEDITARKQAETALQESEAKVRSILDNVGIGVALISPEMEILELNKRMREWFPSIDPGQRPICYQAFNDPPREGVCEYCPTCMTLQDGQVYEATTQTPGAEGTRNIRVVSSPVFDAAGQVTAAIEMVEDISEKLSLESQLRQAQKMEAVGRLAGGVAHDFNNKLAVIIGYTEQVIRRLQPSSDLISSLQEVLNAADRSADLTRQLLAFSRKQTVAPQVLDLNETVTGMLKMLRRLIGEDIDLAWLPAARIWPTRIDPSQLDQIMVNLCVNARDAIPGVGRITLETGTEVLDESSCPGHLDATPGDYVLLTVKDDGCGMDEDTLARIFEPFFTTKEEGKGTGLGLATVYGIVSQNNGFINVSSELGIGTSFKIYLPRHKVAAQERRQAARELEIARGNEDILLVEDEPALLNMVKKMLEGLGYGVLAAATPGEAIRLAQEVGRFHLLLTDVVMPEMNGPDLAKRVVTLHPEIKCLFMSGYAGEHIAHHGVLDESISFIPKPFSTRALATKVRQVLDDKNHVPTSE